VDSSLRTMHGFIWLPEPAPPPDVLVLADAELWCVRDAICQLVGWLPGSEDYCAFIELPGKQNIILTLAGLVAATR
jgi:hypothetical protein